MVCVGSIQMIFKLFYLESYLGSSEARSPNAGSENARGRTHLLAFLGTQARTSLTRRAHGHPGDLLSSASWAPGTAGALGRTGGGGQERDAHRSARPSVTRFLCHIRF